MSGIAEIQLVDDGDAVFAINGNTQIGQQLSIEETTIDPDGTGTLSYIWQSSSDGTTWTQIGSNATYTLNSSEENKKVRTILDYTDTQGFSESVTTLSVDIPAIVPTLTSSSPADNSTDVAINSNIIQLLRSC